MDKQNQKTDTPKRDYVPQFQVRSDLSAGASLDACLKNLDYWHKEYNKMCGGA